MAQVHVSAWACRGPIPDIALGAEFRGVPARTGPSASSCRGTRVPGCVRVSEGQCACVQLHQVLQGANGGQGGRSGPQRAQSELRSVRDGHKKAVHLSPLNRRRVQVPQGTLLESRPMCCSFPPGMTPTAWPAGPHMLLQPKPKIQTYRRTHVTDPRVLPGCGHLSL